MNRTIRFNKELYDTIHKIKDYYSSKYSIDVSFNWCIGHLLGIGIENNDLLPKHLLASLCK